MPPTSTVPQSRVALSAISPKATGFLFRRTRRTGSAPSTACSCCTLCTCRANSLPSTRSFGQLSIVLGTTQYLRNGASRLVLVILTHICEAFHWFPWMHWGLEHSVGHYLDLSSAVLGITFFPIGYLFNVLAKRPA